jgi:hypothetical protein
MDENSELVALLKSTEGLISQFAATPLINKDAIQRQTHVIQANFSSIRGLMRSMEAYIEELDRFVQYHLYDTSPNIYSSHFSHSHVSSYI